MATLTEEENGQGFRSLTKKMQQSGDGERVGNNFCIVIEGPTSFMQLWSNLFSTRTKSRFYAFLLSNQPKEDT